MGKLKYFLAQVYGERKRGRICGRLEYLLRMMAVLICGLK